MKGKLFIFILFVVLLQPVAGMGVGFSICDPETPEGVSACFTLSRASSYSGGGGSGGVTPLVTPTPIQKDVPLLPPATKPSAVVTTPEAIQEAGEEAKREPSEEESKNTFYVVCFGIVFTAVIVIVGVFIIRKNRNL